MLTVTVMSREKMVTDTAEERFKPEHMMSPDQFIASLSDAERKDIENQITILVNRRQPLPTPAAPVKPRA